jgi:hypothetical protein
VNGFNEWKAEKRHECANTAQLQTIRIMMATVRDVDTLVGFLLDSMYKTK